MPSSRSAAAAHTTSTDGVTIERRFTEPGAHPFDAVEWEMRDAVIGDPAKPAFEQRGVEFPKAWSQNATNIVAQKYFRGRAGSDERESSVRQMIGRVSATIAGWGRQHGYFASEEDGNAFEAELTHILLHQMAAFNSPVWFNVGFEESPQCSACQPYHALVSTPEGMVPIGELVEEQQIGREVYDANGTTRIVAVKANGRKAVQRVRLRNGSYIEATPDHVVKAVPERRTEPSWLRVEELEPGMRLHLHPHRARVDQPVLVGVSGATADLSDAAEPTSADRLACAEAALAGWLQADGFVGQYEGASNSSLIVEFQVANDDEFEWVIENLDIALPHVHRHVRAVVTEDRSLDVRRIRMYGEVLRGFVETWDLLDRGTDIRVPSALWTATRDEVVAYLRSLFQADGYVTVRRDGGCEKGRISFAVIGERWTEEVQLLLNTLGIYSRRTRRRERRSNRHDLHEVAISIGSERASFAELVRFIGAAKQRKLLESLSLRGLKRCPDLREEEILTIEDVGVMEVFDIQTESGEYLSNNVAVHNCFILSVEDTIESILDWNTKEGKIFRGGSGAGINLSNIRGSMEHLSKGGLASGPVSFMRGADAWAGTIKSGGKTRRAAKMVVLDVDHPDILDFVWCKAREEQKAGALRDAGFDMSIDGEGFNSIQYQNANNSVRVTSEFMERAERGEDWQTTSRVDGSPVGDQLDAADVLRQIADAAWRCADPGMQYDTTINDWHTCPNSGRINASNPCCFVGDTLVQTSDGPIPFTALHEAVRAGHALPRVEAYDLDSERPAMRELRHVWISGYATDLVEVETSDGSLRCTPEHRFLTADGQFVEARALPADQTVRAVGTRESSSGSLVERVLTAGMVTVRSVRPVTLAEPVAVYDLEVEGLHNFVVRSHEEGGDGIVVHNSEYMHVDDSACNLASLNLMKFRRSDGTFDAETFEHAVDVVILAQEILVGPSSYPTEQIGKNARAFRQLGLGYANLGALLMSNGLPYDSDEGRAVAGAITALMTGRAYRKSAEVAGAIGSYDRFEENRDPHLHVMRKHRAATDEIDSSLVEQPLLAAAKRSWDEAIELGEKHGYRNAQASVLAPTGTISFLLDCDTTGIEPDFSLVKFKELVGGGQMTIVNQTVPQALGTLGYSRAEIDQIVAYMDENATILGAPALKEEHLPVFDVAVGERAISHTGHVKMMAAAQPFLSGAISKSVNLPAEATVEDVADTYMQGWKLGLKALAIYRDGSKTAQALRTDAQDEKGEPEVVVEAKPTRRRMPRERESITHKFSIAGHEGYITAGKYEDGTVGEIFLTDIGKEGSTLRGMMNAFATSVSIALQYGVPLETLVRKFSYMRFDPEGITTNPEIPFAKSMPDYIMRWLASRFLDGDIQEELGILTPEVRSRKAAQDALMRGDTAAPTNGGNGHAGGNGSTTGGASTIQPGTTRAAAEAMTDEPPVMPARLQGLDLGPACAQCGGMMQRTGSCYTCSSCGNNTGCG